MAQSEKSRIELLALRADALSDAFVDLAIQADRLGAVELNKRAGDQATKANALWRELESRLLRLREVSACD